MIKYVLIDIDGTLLDFEAAVEESLDICAKKHGITLPSDFLEIFHPINNSLWKRIEKGELDIAGLRKIRFNLIFEASGISYDGEIFEKDFYACLTNSAIPVSGALELLAYLSEKYILCAASNAAHTQQVQRLTKCGMMPYIKHLFTSEKIGYSKPSENFFKICLENLGAEKDEVIMIGDSLGADIIGAENFGIISCHFTKSEPSGIAHYTVSRLTDIKEIL